MNYISVFVFVKIAWAQFNCPREHVKFEKIIGVRPSSDVDSYLLYKRKIYEPVTFECLSRCLDDNNCLGFVILYNISECYSHEVDILETETVLDPNAVWFEKACFDTGCEKLWIFERIPGAVLIGNGLVTLPERVSRDECERNCLRTSTCRSTRFRIREWGDNSGSCTLSETNRHLSPNSFRAANYDEEYYENQCVEESPNAFCAYEEYDNVIFTQADVHYYNVTKTQCEALCDGITAFNCRGYSLIPMGSMADHLCLIHSGNSKVHGPGLLSPLSGAYFFERARCLNITVACTDADITVRYHPEVSFNGKIYMSGYSQRPQCYSNGKGTEELVLKMPLLGNECGITKAVTIDLNRTLLSGMMILQYNRIIQTQGDRLIKIGCIFANHTKIVLGTGVNFANSSYPNQGAVIINTTTVRPTVEMRIIDIYTKKEVAATQVGQELQLVIKLQPADGPYDLWASHLLAMTENGDESIMLIDDRGCATNPTIFPNLIKIHNNETRQLEGTFNAFKFTTSSIIRFSIIVQFCPVYCAPPHCDVTPKIRRETTAADVKEVFDNGNGTRMPLEFVLLVRNSKIVANRLIYDDNNKILIAGYDLSTNEFCLDISLTIGIIVTWIILQIVLLTCGLLVIRKYKNYYREGKTQSLEDLHKNFRISRRVRWADSGSYT